MIDPDLQARLDALIRALHAGDGAAFGACLAADFEGRGDLPEPAFQSLRASLGSGRISVLRAFFGPSEAAMLVGIFGKDPMLPRAEGIWHAGFDAARRLTRLTVLWDPGAAAPEEGPVARYFSSYTSGDEAAHFACFAPEVLYHGTLISIPIEGLSAVRGVFSAARASLGILGLKPLRTFGRGREQAALVGLYRRSPEHGAPDTEGIWCFRLGEDERIHELSVFWTPAALLT